MGVNPSKWCSRPISLSLFSGTPVSDTVCEHCPVGHFSASDSSSEPCRPHKNCSSLGFKTLRWGTSTMDSLCATQDKAAMLECSHHHTLCHNGEPSGTRQLAGLGWGGGKATSHACDEVFLTKPQLSTAFYQKQTESFQTSLSAACGGFSSVRLASRFHPFPNSRTSAHQHRAQG